MTKFSGVRVVEQPVPDYDEKKHETHKRLLAVSYSASRSYYDYTKDEYENFRVGKSRKYGDYRSFLAGEKSKEAYWRFARCWFPPENHPDEVAASSQLPASEGTAPPSSVVGTDELAAAVVAAPDGGVVEIADSVNTSLEVDLPEVGPSSHDDPFATPSRELLNAMHRWGTWVMAHVKRYKAGTVLNKHYPHPICGFLLTIADEKPVDFMKFWVNAVGSYVAALDKSQADREQRERERQEKAAERERAKVEARHDDNRPIHSQLERLLSA